MKALYVTTRVFEDIVCKVTKVEKLSESFTVTYAPNLLIGVPVVINDWIPDPPGFLGEDDDGTILVPIIKEESEEQND